MASSSPETKPKPSVGRRIVALLVLVLAAWLLLKLIIASISSILWVVVIVALFGAIVWAWRTI